MDETGPAPQSLNTAPMVVAVTWTHDGAAQLGRVAEWVHHPDGWHAFVIVERGHTGGGWLPADRLHPSDHPVATTFTLPDWWTWTPPQWPDALTRFAGAAWNAAEHARAQKMRPADTALARAHQVADDLLAGRDVPTVPWDETKRRLGL